MPYSLLKPPKRELILEFKGSIRYVRKRHPTLVTKVDLIPQPQWKLKILEAIDFNRLSSSKHFHGIMILFTVSYILSEILRMPDDGRNKNVEIFY